MLGLPVEEQVEFVVPEKPLLFAVFKVPFIVHAGTVASPFFIR